VYWIYLDQDRNLCWDLVNTEINLRVSNKDFYSMELVIMDCTRRAVKMLSRLN
jgi:hypothetical protein